jgi:hypothetical protein
MGLGLLYQIDPKFMLPFLSALMMLTFRWRRGYLIEFRRHPINLVKIILIWLGITLILWRVFWQLAPYYFR